jgi:hypothetical protein
MTISLFGSHVKFYSLEISLLYTRDSTVPSSNMCILATNRSGPRMCPQILKFKQVLPNDLIFSLAYQWCDYTSSVSPITGELDWIGGGILGVLRNGGRGVGFRQTVRRSWWWCLLDHKIFWPVGRFPFSKLESNDKLVRSYCCWPYWVDLTLILIWSSLSLWRCYCILGLKVAKHNNY